MPAVLSGHVRDYAICHTVPDVLKVNCLVDGVVARPDSDCTCADIRELTVADTIAVRTMREADRIRSEGPKRAADEAYIIRRLELQSCRCLSRLPGAGGAPLPAWVSNRTNPVTTSNPSRHYNESQFVVGGVCMY